MILVVDSLPAFIKGQQAEAQRGQCWPKVTQQESGGSAAISVHLAGSHQARLEPYMCDVSNICVM